MLIKQYTTEWVNQYQRLRDVLSLGLNSCNFEIEHVGSTAVPGLDAKEIIDIDIIYETPEDFSGVKSVLQRLGYYHNGDQGIKDREVFKREKSQSHPFLDAITHHLYVCIKGSHALSEHLLFRNYLRTNEKARADYQQLKHHLASQVNQHRKAYNRLKETAAREFIQSILELAKSEQSQWPNRS
ncbi:MAG: GrpB family protein [Bacteroidota bacterium]